MRYFIDGYNLLRATDAFDGGPLRDQREKLLRFIEDRRPQGANPVTVVFDGREDVSSPRWPGATRVVFSPGRDADTVIKGLVDDLSNPRDAAVVTDDKAIRRWVGAAGAKVVSCGEFLAAGAPRGGRRAPGLKPSEMDAITDELKDLWKLE